MDWFWQEDGPLALLPWLPSWVVLWRRQRAAWWLQTVMMVDEAYRIHEWVLPSLLPGGVLAQWLTYLIYGMCWCYLLGRVGRLRQPAMAWALAFLAASVLCDVLADLKLAPTAPLEQPLKWAGLLLWARAWWPPGRQGAALGGENS
jgi:hypothetical protein